MSTRCLRIVVPRYGANVSGGSEALVRRLALALHQRHWSIEVFTTTAIDEATWSEGFAPGVSVDEGVRVHRYPVRSGRHPAAFHQLSRAVFRLPPRLRPERFWLRAQGPYAPSLVRALSETAGHPTLFTPYLYHPTVSGLPAAPHPRVLLPAAHDEPALRLRRVGRMITSSDALWFNTEEERELLLRCHPQSTRVPHAIGTVGVDAPNDIDVEGFRRRRQLDDYLLYGGRVTRGKGVTDLLTGFAELRTRRPRARLVLMGDASTGQAVPPGVLRIGRVPDAERWAAVAGARAVVVPSSMESLSLITLEAWATGRPCIVNGASAVLGGQAARSAAALVYQTSGEFADAAEQLLTSPSAADAMGERGRRFVAQRYRWDDVVERLERLLRAAISR